MNKYMAVVIILLCISLIFGGVYYYMVFNAYPIKADDVVSMEFSDFSGNKVKLEDKEKLEEFTNIVKKSELKKGVSKNTKGKCAFNIKVKIKTKDDLHKMEIGTDTCKIFCLDDREIYLPMTTYQKDLMDFISKLGLDTENFKKPVATDE